MVYVSMMPLTAGGICRPSRALKEYKRLAKAKLPLLVARACHQAAVDIFETSVHVQALHDIGQHCLTETESHAAKQ